MSKETLECAQTHPVDILALKGAVLPEFQAKKLFSKLPEKERESITYEVRRGEERLDVDMRLPHRP